MCEKTKGSKCKRIINTTTIQAEKRDIQLILDIKNKKKHKHMMTTIIFLGNKYKILGLVPIKLKREQVTQTQIPR